MWFPDWLYERLPLIYLAAGAACLGFFGLTVAGSPSALLFFAAAVRAYTWRRSERQATIASSAARRYASHSLRP